MSPNPKSFLDHLREEAYHSRSDKHSNSLARAIVDDLIRHCPLICQRAAAGELVYSLNFTLPHGTADWNVDLVFGPPEFETNPPESGTPILERPPATVQIAIEIKAVMTEHRKAVKNRKRNLEAHHEHVHNYNSLAVAGGVLVVDAAPTFQSPLRDEPTTHRNPDKLIEHCLAELRSVAARGGSTGYGLEAACAIVVNMSNDPSLPPAYLTKAPHQKLAIHSITTHSFVPSASSIRGALPDHSLPHQFQRAPDAGVFLERESPPAANVCSPSSLSSTR